MVNNFQENNNKTSDIASDIKRNDVLYQCT